MDDKAGIARGGGGRRSRPGRAKRGRAKKSEGALQGNASSQPRQAHGSAQRPQRRRVGEIHAVYHLAELAHALTKRLPAVLDVDPRMMDWVDVQSQVSEGDDVRRCIRKAMQDAAMVVVVASPQSTDSPWVQYEAGMAMALDKPIIVVKPEDWAQTGWLQGLPANTKILVFDAAMNIRPH